MLTDRRRFIKTLFVTTATSALATGNWQGLLVVDATAAIPAGPCWLRLAVADFPALARPGGSVRIGTSPISNNFPRGLYWPIIVNRLSDAEFTALDSQCPHAGCVVRPADSTTRTMRCPCHQSLFAIDGGYLNGPANVSLGQYPVRWDGAAFLDIELPPWVYAGPARVIDAGANLPARFAIEFNAFSNLTYEIRFRAAVGDPWVSVAFALSPNGLTNQTSAPGQDDILTVYVDRPSAAGFFTVILRTSVV